MKTWERLGNTAIGLFVLMLFGVIAYYAVRPAPQPAAAQGWIDSESDREPIARQMTAFSSTPAYTVSRGDEPKFVYLWDSYRKLFGRNPPEHDQNPVGSCVAFGTCRAIERTLATELTGGHAKGEFVNLVCEIVYAGSRVEIGGGRIRGDGSIGAWAAQFVTKYGVVPRGTHGQYDLSRYDPNRCRMWGSSGVPTELETVARQFPVKDAARVTSWAEAKKALAQGYGIAICSNQGFTRQRDANGICRPSGVWQHCMALDGYHTDANGREFGHIENSWGDNYHTGPVGWGNPNKAGFWTDSATINRMLSQGDSWAFSGTTGFPSRKIDWDQFGVIAPNKPRDVVRRELPLHSLSF
jgi:hypothetical protein